MGLYGNVNAFFESDAVIKQQNYQLKRKVTNKMLKIQIEKICPFSIAATLSAIWMFLKCNIRVSQFEQIMVLEWYELRSELLLGYQNRLKFF